MGTGVGAAAKYLGVACRGSGMQDKARNADAGNAGMGGTAGFGGAGTDYQLGEGDPDGQGTETDRVAEQERAMLVLTMEAAAASRRLQVLPEHD